MAETKVTKRAGFQARNSVLIFIVQKILMDSNKFQSSRKKTKRFSSYFQKCFIITRISYALTARLFH
ncbi:hypothetical protein Tanf_02255 [Tannerella forsythia]|nr:hypothetical protein Tanf_02255 [Tannerella forsythia]OLQ20817.1 hypothetical protein BGK60_04115 [Tannerella forsythia]